MWTLSGRLSRCGHCGKVLYTNLIPRKNKKYFFYRCPTVRDNGADACVGGSWGAEYMEPLVWEFVYQLLSRPEIVLTAIDARIENEEGKLSSPVEDYEFWSSRLKQAEQKEDRWLEMYAEGTVSRQKRDEKIEGCDEEMLQAGGELEKLDSLTSRILSMKRDRESIKDSYERKGRRGLELATDADKRKLYRILGLKVFPCKDPQKRGKRMGKDSCVRVEGKIVEAIWGDSCTFGSATEVAAMYNFTNRMSLACGMIPNEEYHDLAR